MELVSLYIYEAIDTQYINQYNMYQATRKCVRPRTFIL